MAEHFRSRTDMIEWLIANCPRPGIVRALQNNKVEFLGGFRPIPPSDLPGWIFKIKDKNVCILANDKKHKYEIRIVKRVPWENWCGEFHGLTLIGGLSCGDKPLENRRLYDAAKNESKRNSS